LGEFAEEDVPLPYSSPLANSMKIESYMFSSFIYCEDYLFGDREIHESECSLKNAKKG